MKKNNEMEGWEEEIESAVDHLFQEERREIKENISIEFPKLEGIPPASSIPLSTSKAVEQLESQLLSLEWEISKKNLEKTRREILNLKEALRDEPETTPVLNFMENVLTHMMEDEENIQPKQTHFLLDSMETIKLLMKKDKGGEFNVYKKLILSGIEARYDGLKGFKESRSLPLPSSLPKETEVKEISSKMEKQMEVLSHQMSLFSLKMDEIFKEIDHRISSIDQMSIPLSEKVIETETPLVLLTVFKIDERFFGVESDKVFKLFKVPQNFYEFYPNPHKIQLKEIEVRMINFNQIFSIPERDRKAEMKIITVKNNGEYIGWAIDQAFKEIPFCPDLTYRGSDDFLGVIHWLYQGQSIEIPIINLKRFKDRIS